MQSSSKELCSKIKHNIILFEIYSRFRNPDFEIKHETRQKCMLLLHDYSQTGS